MNIVFFALGMLFAWVFALAWLCVARKRMSRLYKINDDLKNERAVTIASMRKLASDLEGGISVPDIYRRTLKLAVDVTKAQSGRIYERKDDGTWKSVVTMGLFPPQRHIKNDFATKAQYISTVFADEVLSANEGLVGQVGNSAEGLFVKDAAKDNRVVSSAFGPVKITSIIYVPVFFVSKTSAVMVLANPLGDEKFSQNDFSLAKAIASQAAIAISNANTMDVLVEKNRLNFDLKLASGVQRYLLPQQMPEIDGYDFAVRYVPQQCIGGDFYDFIDLGNQKLGVVIADVSGKGVSAAMIMAITQTKLREIAPRHESPAEALKALNADMMPLMREDMFITMIYAVIDAKNSSITLARAGHEPALLFDKSTTDFESMKIKSAGMAVGMVDSEIFDTVIEDKTFAFEKSAVLVMYTDGITESLSKNGGEFTAERLEKSIASVANESAADINTDILLDVQRFCGATYSYADDMTLITIKHTN